MTKSSDNGGDHEGDENGDDNENENDKETKKSETENKVLREYIRIYHRYRDSLIKFILDKEYDSDQFLHDFIPLGFLAVILASLMMLSRYENIQEISEIEFLESYLQTGRVKSVDVQVKKVENENIEEVIFFDEFGVKRVVNCESSQRMMQKIK